jgi:hypothetical protein
MVSLSMAFKEYQMTIAFVYKWTQLSTGMWYIGSRSSKNCHPNDGYICSSKFVKPLIEANPNDWLRQILMYSNNVSKIRELEAYTLQDLNAKHNPMSYNQHNNDGNFFPLDGHSDDTKRKISERTKGKTISDEHRRRITEAWKNKSLEERQKITEKLKKRIFSEETRHKMSESNKGKVLSEEHRRKLSETKKGVPVSKEHRRKLSEAKKGRKLGPRTEETKRKISETKRNKNKV